MLGRRNARLLSMQIMNGRLYNNVNRPGSLAFAVFWLAIVTVFSFGSHYANALAIYSLLALLVGVRSTCLVRQDVPRSVSGVLAYAGALHFGAMGGLTVGLTAGIGLGVSGHSASHNVRGLKTGLQAGIAGLVAGLVRAYLLKTIEPVPIAGVATIFGPAVACLAVLLIGENIAGYQRSWGLANRRMHGNRITVEFGVGVAVAAVAYLILEVTAWQPVQFLLPLIYLMKASLSDLTADEYVRQTTGRNGLADLYLATIESLVSAIDAKERYKIYHTKGVEQMAVAIAQQMRLSPNEVEGVRTAALLHDIGRLGVPEHILHKPGKLDADEFAKVQAHSAIGEKILDSIGFPWPIGAMIRNHHERWDGSGYPDGLSGEEIPLGARILAVADVYDAMTNKRLYRSDCTPEQAVEYITSSAGRHLDPDVVAAFQAVIEQYGLPACQKVLSGEAPAPGDPRRAASGDGLDNSVQSDISRAGEEFLAMYEIAQTSSTTLNLDEVLSLVAGKMRSMVQCSTCAIFLLDNGADVLRVRIAQGINDRHFEDATTSLGRGLTGMVASTEEGLVAVYDSGDLMFKRMYMQWIDLQSVMIAPICHGGQVLGTINLYDIQADAFSAEDFRLLNAVTPQIGQAIRNAQLFEETRQSALTDVLTGLHNARYMLLHLEQEISRARRASRPVSVLGLDLDNFKPINDTFGHQQGDTVLRELGQVFISQVRDYDVVCRYAGDEFIIILPDTDKTEAMETADRIREAVDKYNPGFHHDQPVRVGVSVGVSTFPADGADVGSLIAQADAAMYADKRGRRESRRAA